MKDLFTMGFTNDTLNLVGEAITLLRSNLVWSQDFEELKPILIQVLAQYNETSILLAKILLEE
jgi:hypothetical protein